MNKIGIITFHRSHNNGSMLQTLALQYILKSKYSLDIEIIDYSNEGQRNMYAIFPKADNAKRIIKNIIWATQYKQLKKQYNAYNKFIYKYFILSPKIYLHSQELKELESVYDAVIAGSDQIWNICCRDADDAYYLDFLDKTLRYAYAISFGANNPFEIDGNRDTHKKLISNFSKISVRENNAQKWIRESLGITVPICLDPTMLLTEKEWESIIDVGNTAIIPGKYIYYYCFSISNDVQKFLKWLSNKYNMPVYFMDVKEWTLKGCWKNNIKLIKEYGPDVYMNIVKNAYLFVTTSFHGTAFATIYRKNFWYISSGKIDEKDDRAQSFLSQLGLMERYKTINELMQTDMLMPPDYIEPYRKLNDLRNQSYGYISEIVNDIKEKEIG